MPNLTVTELPSDINVGATGVHRSPYHIEIHQRLGGAGTYSPPPPLGGGSDDKARLDTWLASTAANSTLYFKEGYLVSAPLVFPTGRVYQGRGYAEFAGGGVKLMNGANPADATTAVMVPKEWNDNNTAGGSPTMFEGFFIDGNAANNTGTYSCLLLYNYWSRVVGCRFDSPRLHHLLLTPRTKNSTLSVISHADNWIMHNRFRLGLAGTDGAGVRHIRPAGQPATNTDVRCISNHFEAMQHGIWSDDAAGWTIFDNHIYAQRNGIKVDDGWFALTVLANYIDSFGVENVAGSNYGIFVKGWGGGSRLPSVHGNQVNGPDPIPANATNRYWYWINGGADAAACSVVGNRALGPFNNPSAKAHGFTFDASAGTVLFIDAANLAQHFNAGQAREYVGAGSVAYPYPRVETGTAAWTPGAIAGNAGATTSVTVTGAALGDPVAVGYNQDLQDGLVLTGEVSAANTVTVQIRNVTAGSLTPTAGTVRATVWKH